VDVEQPNPPVFVVLVSSHATALPTLSTLPTGYNHPVDEVLNELLECLDHPALPVLQWKDELSYVESRLPPGAHII
jgi:hypothetical protein